MGAKGDWKRPTNPQHAPTWVREQIDMGLIGCKRGYHFYVEWKKCKYCGKLMDEKLNERDGCK